MKQTLNVKLFALLFMPAMLLSGCKQKAEIDLPAIFSDNLVLQQNTDVTIWGKATPGATIKADGEWGKTASAKAGKDSLWQLKLTTIDAGGPYSLALSTSDTTIQIRNVMLGEVWLASGQSNMEMPLKGWPPKDTILNSASTIAESDNPSIRMFTVNRNMAADPLSDVSGFWAVSNSGTSGEFSATAYYFAKKLNKELNIPVGIIHSSWGGTPIEAWVSNPSLSSNQDFDSITKDLKKLAPELKAYNQWLGKLQHVSILSTEDHPHPFKELDIFDDYCSDPETPVDEWPVMFLPSTFEQSDIGQFDGVVWFRKEIMIPESWEGKELTLSMGPIDDMDAAYFNGEKIGGTEVAGFWQKVRYYTIPADAVEAGKATLAVKVIDTQGGGGIHGDSKQLKIHPKGLEDQSIALKGKWYYKVVGQIAGDQLYLFDPETNTYDTRPKLSMSLNSHTPTVLYNAMIAPLTPFTINGAIWYQGETNVGRAVQYQNLMKTLISDWRQQFDNSELPFYFVQLAPWHYNEKEGISSARLREAQRRSMKIPNTGMAVTLDIGNINNIHPANKQDVGERLAFWALAQNYGHKEIAYSGPLPDKTERRNGKMIITFKHTGEGLRIKSDVPNQFEIAGLDGKFIPAEVKINGNTLEVYSPRVSEPTDVRYAFKNGAEASLFNEAGLPAPSFSTEEEL